MANRFIEYHEKLTDWVIDNFGYTEDKNPNHAMFSAANVADIIMEYNKQRLSYKNI